MANEKARFMRKLSEQYGPMHKLERSQSLYEIGDGRARIYIRYSKVHGRNRTFYSITLPHLRYPRES
jgi:hypothetical protein